MNCEISRKGKIYTGLSQKSMRFFGRGDQMFEAGYLTAGGGLSATASVNTAETYLANNAINIAIRQVVPSILENAHKLIP
jgi:hypothetical protein